MNEMNGTDNHFFRCSSSWVVFAGFVLTFSGLDLWRLYTWRATAMDLGWYSQALWLIAYGHWKAYDTIIQAPALADAASYVLYPFAIIYRFFGQLGILIFQVSAVGSGIFGVSWLANHFGRSRSERWWWIFLYVIYPAVVGPTIFDWHPDVLFIPALFLTIWAIEEKRLWEFLIGIGLTALIKDVGAAVVIFVAVPLMLKRYWGWALAAIGWGLSVVALDFLVVMPAIYPHGIAVWGATYGWIGSNPESAIVRLLSHPRLVLEALTRFQVVFYWMVLLVPLGLLVPFMGISDGYIVPALAVLLFNGLSGLVPQFDPFNQYTLPAVPFLFASTVGHLPSQKSGLKTAFMVGSLLISLFVFWTRDVPISLPLQPHAVVLTRMASQIPPAAPVIGTDYSLAPLANRVSVTLISTAVINHARPGTYALIDLSDQLYQILPYSTLRSIVVEMRQSPKWSVLEHKGIIWLFRKG